jgi:hypothetical protein
MCVAVRLFEAILEKQIVQAERGSVVFTGRGAFSQSGPLTLVSRGFTLLPRRLLPILANELPHAQPAVSLFVANSSAHCD